MAEPKENKVGNRVVNRNWVRIIALGPLLTVMAFGAWLVIPTGGSKEVAASSSTECGAIYDQPKEGAGGDEIAWAITPEASSVFTRLREIVEGSPSLLDLRVHYSKRTVLFVIDPGSKVPASVAESIRESLTSIGAEAEFIAGCAARADLERTSAAVSAAMAVVVSVEDFKRFGGVAVSTDLAAGRVRLEADLRIGEKILSAMGADAELVDLVEGAPEVLSRSADAPPFTGGASFTTYDSGTPVGVCTSGFGARFAGFGSFDVMATAAHCGVGGAVPMGAYNSGW
jgi:hypothetical protein